MKENAAGVGADLMMSDPSGVTMLHSFQRTGCMAAFESFSQFENYFDEILDLLEVSIMAKSEFIKIIENESKFINILVYYIMLPKYNLFGYHFLICNITKTLIHYWVGD